MKTIKQFLLLLFVCFFFLFNAQSKIIGIKAKLFYNENKTNGNNTVGTFSENLIGNKDFTLWNTIIGEGSSEGYSNQTLVTVEISSNFKSNKKQQIKLIATSGKKVILQQIKSISVVNNPALYNMIFVLDGTGCEEINLKAELLYNGKVISTMNKKILFDCGE